MYSDFVCGLLSQLYLELKLFFFFKDILSKLSFEYKHNKLLFGIRISSIEASRQKLEATHLFITLCLTYNKEIHPGATPFSRAKGFRVISGKVWYLRIFPLKEASRHGSKGRPYVHDGSCD